MVSLAVYKATLALFIVATASLGGSTYYSQQQMATQNDKVSTLTSQLSNSTSQVSSLNDEIASLKNQISQLQTQLNNLRTPTGNAVPLPSYLDRCVTGNLVYHAHPNLSIIINGTSVTIPAGVGIQGTCLKPIHTHTADGILHIETNVSTDYKLSDFFLIWGNWANNAQLAIFNSTQIFGARAVQGHTLTMTVNGYPNSSFQNYVLPRNSGSTVDPCSMSPCVSINIVITYT